MKSAALEPMEEDEMQKMNRVNEAGRNHEGMAVAKL